MVLMKSSLAVERGDLLAPHFIVLQLKRFTLDIAVSMLPLLSIMLVVALFSPIALGGWSFSLQAMAPKFERISPLAGVKRIFSVQSAMELLKSLQEFSKARMMTDVPKADVIITNPTHFAVALKYQPKTMDAPVVFVVNLRNAKRNGDPWPKAPNPDIPEGFLDPYEPPGINA